MAQAKRGTQSRKPAAKKRPAKKTAAQERVPSYVWMLGLALLAVFVTLSLLTDATGIVGRWIGAFLKGLLGIPAFLLPVLLLAAVLGTSAAVGTELIWPFFAVGGAAVLLPITERIAGPAYPLFFLGSLLFFLLRSVHICLLRRRELHTQISSISIKEAIDSLDTGLLFLRPKGEILLCNRRMEMLAQKMIGHPLHSGREFQQILEDGPLSGGCVREVLGGQQVFRFSDASVWSISSHEIPVGRRTCILFTADDVAEQWNAVTLLAQQNEALEKRGQELRHTIEHLQAICEAEEIVRSKGIHQEEAKGGFMTFWGSASASCSGLCGTTNNRMKRCC